jgi:predicted MFS family arabinose efflux permease
LKTNGFDDIDPNYTMPPGSSSKVFYVLIVSQFCGTSLWFAGNAVLPQLQLLYGWQPDALGYLTSSVQLGFILGTLSLALSGITDRFSPSSVFFLSSALGAISNALSLLDISSFGVVLTSRLLTGFFLAGIYPVGMKIASDWSEKGLGHWLGSLVGALVLGTSFPHIIKLFPGFVQAEIVLIAVSGLAVAGGLLVWRLIPDGPFRKTSIRFSFLDLRKVFRVRSFRSPAFGYFGHMWELYAFWAFVPWAISQYNTLKGSDFSISLWAFIIIAAGAAGCLIGGLLSQKISSERIAALALMTSGACCFLSPLFFQLSPELFFGVMIFWGFMVVADSPQFSALVAANAPQEIRGSAITITTCIGFAITIVSIQLLNFSQAIMTSRYLFLLLAPGPVFGIVALLKKTIQKA